MTDAMAADFDQVRIMTGKGKGVVQSAVMQYLKLGKFSWVYEKLPNGKMNEGVLVIRL